MINKIILSLLLSSTYTFTMENEWIEFYPVGGDYEIDSSFASGGDSSTPE